MSFFAELKRRNVIRVGVAYLVASWLLIEVSSLILDIYNAPGWVSQVIVALLAVGFPVALFFAWAFEVTPEGIKRESQVDRTRSVSHATARRLDLVTIAMVVLAGALLVGDRLLAPGSSEPPESVASAEGRSSIAVLPFVNMSADVENEYFADGISEELLNILAGVEGLDVASRTSAFSFKGKDTPIPEIARTLGVRHVLEGSVRRQGARVRITAQLIDAERDVHLWSKSYDRDLTDIFVVQEEIAQAITDALYDILGTRQVEVQASTGNMEAYERFLAARARFYQREDIERTLDDLREVVAMDPELTDAWAFMAAAAFVNITSNPQRTHDDAMLVSWINEGVERALAADPRHSLALATRGGNAFRMGDISGALQALARAAANERTGSTAHLWSGIHWLLVGEPGAALPMFQEAHRRDPLVAINQGYLAIANLMTGQRAEALQLGRQILASNAGNAAVMLAQEFALSGEADLAIEFFAYSLRGSSDLSVVQQTAIVAAYAAALDDPALRDAFIEEHASQEVFTPFYRAVFEDPGFFDFMHSEEFGYVFTLPAWLPSASWMREHPEFFQYMDDIGVAAYWAESGYPDGCTRVDEPDGPRLECGGAD